MSQALMIKFGSDTSAARSAIVELASTVAQSAVTMATAIKGNVQNVQSLSGVIQALPTAVRASVGAFVAFQAISFVMDGVTRSAEAAMARLSDVLKIATDAKAAGVGATFFQALSGQAEALSMKSEQMVAILARAREAATVNLGEGKDAPVSVAGNRIARNVKAGNLDQGDLDRYNGAVGQEDRIRVVLDLLTKLQEKGADLAAFDLARTMFGADFENKMRNGADIIARVRTALDALKNGDTASGGTRLLTDAELDLAERINQQLLQAKQTLAEGIAPIQRDIALYELQQAEALQLFTIKVYESATAFASLYAHVKSVGEEITKLGYSQVFKDINAWLKQKGLMSDPPPGFVNSDDPSDLKDAPDKTLKIKIAPKGDASKNLPSLAKSKHDSGSAEKDPVDTYIAGLSRATAALKAEIDNFDASNRVKAEAIAMAKAYEIAEQNGTKVTEAQVAKLKEASGAAAEYKDKLADLEQKQRQAAESARYFGNAMSDAFSDAIFNGGKLSDIMRNLSASVGRQAISALMTGSGPLAGFLGTAAPASAGSNALGGLFGAAGAGSGSSGGSGGIGALLSAAFGGFRANGGPVQAGRTYRVNELGEEYFTPDTDGRITPAGRGGGMGAGGGVTIIDQRTMEAPAPEVRSGPGGSSQIILRDAEKSLAGRGRAGRGPLGPLLNTPGTRRG